MEIILTRTVNYKGQYYSPDSIVDWPEKVAAPLIDDGAAEPVLNVQPEEPKQTVKPVMTLQPDSDGEPV